MIPARPPGFTIRGSAASSRSSAPSSSFTAIRSAWNTRVAGSMSAGPRHATPHHVGQVRRSSRTASSSRRSTIRRATRRLCRSSPYSQNTSASPASLIVFTRSAAVAPVVGSSRMSSGPSSRKLSPRAGLVHLVRREPEVREHAVDRVESRGSRARRAAGRSSREPARPAAPRAAAGPARASSGPGRAR